MDQTVSQRTEGPTGLTAGYVLIRRKHLLLIAGMIVCSFVLSVVSIQLGSADIGFGDVVNVLLGKSSDPFVNSIIWDIRFPRAVVAIIAGVGLAVAGASMQGVLRNPLVDPFTLGIANGAALGAAIAIILKVSIFGSQDTAIVVNAFVFAMLASMLILALGRLRGVSAETFILVGIALTFIFGAVTGMLQYIASDAEISMLVSWSFGSVARPTVDQTLISLLAVGVGVPMLMAWSWKLNAVSLSGDEVAQSLGVHPGRLRMHVMIVSSAITASIIAFTGLIGFVGLVAPHIARLLVGGDFRYMIAVSGLLGIILVLISDIIGRTVIAPAIIPVGIMLSFVGGPFFLYLLMARRGEFWQ